MFWTEICNNVKEMEKTYHILTQEVCLMHIDKITERISTNLNQFKL